MTHLQGRVFTRLAQYSALPADFQDEVRALEHHLMTVQNELFDTHHPRLLKATRGVRYKLLLDTIDEYLEGQRGVANTPTHVVTTTATTSQQPTRLDTVSIGSDEQHSSPTLKDKALQLKDGVVATAKSVADAAKSRPTANEPSSTTPATLPAGAPLSTPATNEAVTHGATIQPASTASTPLQPTMAQNATAMKNEVVFKASAMADAARGVGPAKPADKYVEALVLKGFITPYKESDKFCSRPEAFSFKESDLFVPVAPVVTGLAVPTITVWDLAEGAAFAGMLKRKAGILTAITQGKEVYAVVNARGRNLTLFDSDTGRESILQVDAIIDNTHVVVDKAHADHGVKVSNETVSELFFAGSVSEHDAFVEALRATGMLFPGDDLPDASKMQEPVFDSAAPPILPGAIAKDTTGITDPIPNLHFDEHLDNIIDPLPSQPPSGANQQTQQQQTDDVEAEQRVNQSIVSNAVPVHSQAPSSAFASKTQPATKKEQNVRFTDSTGGGSTNANTSSRDGENTTKGVAGFTPANDPEELEALNAP